MKIKMKNRSHRYSKNRARPCIEHKYTKCKECPGTEAATRSVLLNKVFFVTLLRSHFSMGFIL